MITVLSVASGIENLLGGSVILIGVYLARRQQESGRGHPQAILEAKNERTASLYLDGLLDTEEHRRLEADRAKVDLDHQHARREVERLHLIVRLLGTQASEGIQG